MTVLVASTEAGAGKTAVALALAKAAANRGRDIGYMKPVGTWLGVAAGDTLDGDPDLAREVLGLESGTREMEPVVYSPAFVQAAVRGREDPEALAERVREAFDRLVADRDGMVLEGGGPLTAGGVVGLTDASVAELLDVRVVLVAPYEDPGDIDDVLAAADLLGDQLGGVLFNAVPDAAFDGLASDIVPFLEGRGVRVFGTVPRAGDIAGIAVSEAASALDAEVLTSEASTDGRLEQVVGTAISSETPRDLRRASDAALVAADGQSDVLTAALGAPNIDCLILTGGRRPDEAVLRRADSAGVPVLLVRTDAEATVDRVEDILRRSRTRDAGTVGRIGGLLADYADIDAMLEAGDLPGT